MLFLGDYCEPTKCLSDLLVWTFLGAPGVVVQKGGALQKTWRFRGPDLESASDAEFVAGAARLNNAFKRLGSGWSIFAEARRQRMTDYPRGRWPTAASRVVDLERRRRFQKEGVQFESEYHLTLVWQLPTVRMTRVADLLYTGGIGSFIGDSEPADALQKDLDYFLRAAGECAAIMEGSFPLVEELDDDETLTYLHSTISMQRHRVRTPATPAFLDTLLPDEPLTPGDDLLLGDHYLVCSTVTGFPLETSPCLFDELNRLGIEYRWMTRFICLDPQDAKRELSRLKKHWFTKRKSALKLASEQAFKDESQLVDNSATDSASDVDDALRVLGAGHAAYGYLTTTFVVWDRDLHEAHRKQQLLAKTIQSLQFVVRRETMNSVNAWLGSLPGHIYANVRRPIVSTLNLVHMLPASAIWTGDPANTHLLRVTGHAAPHMHCSADGSPFRLNLNVDDVGHTIVLGPTSSGKSTLAQMLAMQWLRYPRAQIFQLDFERSCRAATLANGGVYLEPGNPNAPCAFQPLARVHEVHERLWAAGFILQLLRFQSVQTTDEVRRVVEDSIAHLSQTRDCSHRTLTTLATYLRSHSNKLADALSPYTVDGPFGQIFDAAQEEIPRTRWTSFEMMYAMALGADVCVPLCSYLFQRRIRTMLDGSPTFVSLDEVWRFWKKDPQFVDETIEAVKTARKHHAYFAFYTTEVADFARDERLRSALMSACKTTIYLPDKEALAPATARIYRDAGLSDVEIGLIATATPQHDYYYRSSKGKRLFSLDLGPVALTFAGAAGPADQAFMDEMVASRDPSEYAEALLERRSGTDWAVQVLRQERFAERSSHEPRQDRSAA